MPQPSSFDSPPERVATPSRQNEQQQSPGGTAGQHDASVEPAIRSLDDSRTSNETSSSGAPSPISTTGHPQGGYGKDVMENSRSSIYYDIPLFTTAHTAISSPSLPARSDVPDSPHSADLNSQGLPHHEFDPSYRRTGSQDASTKAIKALDDAVTAGFRSTPRTQIPVMLQTHSPKLRMPLQSSSSQSSLGARSQAEAIPPPSMIDPSESSKPMYPAYGLRGLGIVNPGISRKVPPTRRPPHLNMDAVQDLSGRPSLTSLTDLIRRATRVASSLDRSNATSRLSKLGRLNESGGHDRQSTLSDMISSFPAPVTGGTPRTATPQFGTARGGTPHARTHLGEMTRHRSEKSVRRGRSTSEKPQTARKGFCGMSLPVSILIFTVLVLVIALVVLLVVLLVWVPNNRKGSSITLAHCVKSKECLHGGTSTVVNGSCECVCSNGFSGPNCSGSADTTDCTIATLSDGSTTYTNSTMGTLVYPLFQDADQFKIPLNVSIILSTFSSNDLSCSAENTLVDLNLISSNARRFVIAPGLTDVGRQRPVPSTTLTTRTKSDRALAGRRRSATGSSDGIVFEASSATATESSAASTAVTPVNTTTPTATTAASTTTSSSTASLTTTYASEEQQTFARLVVLYALQQSYNVAFAANAQQSIRLHFSGASSGNGSVQVGTVSLPLTVDFDNLSITNADGTVVGDSSA